MIVKTRLAGYRIPQDDDYWLKTGQFWLLNIIDEVASLKLCSQLCMVSRTSFNTYLAVDSVTPNSWIYKQPLKQCACLFYYGDICLNYYGKKRFEWEVNNSPQEGITFQGDMDTEKIERLAENLIVFNLDRVENKMIICYGKIEVNIYY